MPLKPYAHGSGVIPVAGGGTGASDPATARANIEAIDGIRARSNEGSLSLSRSKIHFINGQDVSITVDDDGNEDEIEVTISATATPLVTGVSSQSGITANGATSGGLGSFAAVVGGLSYSSGGRSGSSVFAATPGGVSHTSVGSDGTRAGIGAVFSTDADGTCGGGASSAWSIGANNIAGASTAHWAWLGLI